MLCSCRLLILIKLILFELLGFKCAADDSFRRYRRLRSSLVSTPNVSSASPVLRFMTLSVDDHFAVINCSTPERVPHHKLDWYFRTRDSSRSPRVIWQRGRSNILRYVAYSPDQIRHFLQIKPVQYNDSGTYTCLDQTSGFYAGVELLIDHSHSYAERLHGLPLTTLIGLVVVAFFVARYAASESQVT